MVFGAKHRRPRAQISAFWASRPVWDRVYHIFAGRGQAQLLARAGAAHLNTHHTILVRWALRAFARPLVPVPWLDARWPQGRVQWYQAMAAAGQRQTLDSLRLYTPWEDRADAALHLAGVGLALPAVGWLLLRAQGGAQMAAVLVYCAGLLAMICASAAYNLAPPGRVKNLLRRLDHAAIFVMIAGTYTPFAVGRLGQTAGREILALVWSAALFGVALKLLFPRRFEKAGIVLYLSMGWLIVMALRPLAASVAAPNLWLLMAGALIYSAGVLFYVVEKIPYHKVIWHGFVLVAVFLHFTAIANEFAISPPPGISAGLQHSEAPHAAM